MKKLIVSCLILVAMLVLSIPVNAQDDTLEGFYFVQGTSGTLTDNGDGTYALTLQEVSPEIFWVVYVPAPDSNYYDLLRLVTAWGAAPEGLETTAMLTTVDAVYHVTLSAPAYDEMLQEFTATITVNEIVAGASEDSKDDKSAGEVAEEFEAAVLSINTNTALETALVEGLTAMAEEGRESSGGSGCNPRPPRWLPLMDKT